MKILPQEGFQTKFLSSPADIVIGGGAAGVGKTFCLLLEFLRHAHRKNWGGVIFRRTSPEITNEGGLWDTSEELYLKLEPHLRPTTKRHTYTFPSGAKLRFSHLQHEKNKLSWQGSQIPYVGWDELTHFTKTQFFYLLTRQRSTTGITPYIRCTTNPQGNGWVKNLIQWWLYPDDYIDEHLAGFPIPERAGVIRYFTQYKGRYVWGNTPIEVLEELPAEFAKNLDVQSIKSITFIPGKLEENEILLNLNPSYKANLLAQDEELVEQLYKGRWIKLTDDRLKLYKYNSIVDCFTNSFVDFGEKYITADIALEGADKFVAGVWSGFRLTHVYSFAKSMGNEVLQSIERIAKRHKVPVSNIAFDNDGVGGYLKGFLRTAYPFVNNSRAIEVEGQPQNYKNLRAQCYFLLKKFINDYQMFFDISDEMLIDTITEELDAISRKENNTLVLDVISSSEIRALISRSPDYASMIMMRMIFTLPIKKRGGKRRTKVI